jgi:hypothetical protein
MIMSRPCRVSWKGKISLEGIGGDRYGADTVLFVLWLISSIMYHKMELSLRTKLFLEFLFVIVTSRRF